MYVVHCMQSRTTCNEFDRVIDSWSNHCVIEIILEKPINHGRMERVFFVQIFPCGGQGHVVVINVL